MINWIYNLQQLFLQIRATDWFDVHGLVWPQRDRLSGIIKAMYIYLTLEVPKLVEEKKAIFLPSSAWPSQDVVPVISGLLGFPYTCFTYTTKYRASKEMKKMNQRWFLADVVGDGANPLRFHIAFTHKECSECIVRDARFCTTGMSRTQMTGSNLCHFYPISTHTKDMTRDYEEALEALAMSLFRNKVITEYRY